jgi:ATP-dependent DNA helicase HFM1/MER3
VAKHSSPDPYDVEVVDLAEGDPAVPYSKQAPRDYRKLHNLRTSVQESDTSVRLPKQKPQFSYASGNEPDLPFLRKSKVQDDGNHFGSETSDDEDFPSPSAIPLVRHLKEDSDDRIEFGNVDYEDPMHTSADLDDTLEDLEAGILDMDDPMAFQPPTPKVSTSFAEGIFDFNAFEENYVEPDPYSSPLMSSTIRKRAQSPSQRLPESKYRRISQDAETSPADMNSVKQDRSVSLKYGSLTPSEVSVVESRRIKIQDLIEDPQPKAEDNTQQQSVPAWVNEFDADLIMSLMGSVDFVE